MIYPQTMLTVADNTGAKKVMCIRVLGGSKKYAIIVSPIFAYFLLPPNTRIHITFLAPVLSATVNIV